MLIPTDELEPVPAGQFTNVFLCLQPERRVAKQLYSEVTRLCSHAVGHSARRPAEIFHMTLQPIGAARGRAPFQLLQKLDAAIGMIRFPEFPVALDQALSFRSSSASAPFVATAQDGLTDAVALQLAARSALEIKELNVPPARTFTPHMTLAYSRERSARLYIPPLLWWAREIRLIESWIGRTKYVELGRWPLRQETIH